jgi:hypothetical protein
MSKKSESWKNMQDYNKGKAKLKNAVLQHPAEDPNNSIYTFMKSKIKRNLWTIPRGNFKNIK